MWAVVCVWNVGFLFIIRKYLVEPMLFICCVWAQFLTFISHMMTQWNGNIFRVTGPLCGEFTGHRWIPLTKASDAEFWCFFLICAWMNSLVNNHEAVDLRHHRTHYDVTVMISHHLISHIHIKLDSDSEWFIQHSMRNDNSQIVAWSTSVQIIVHKQQTWKIHVYVWRPQLRFSQSTAMDTTILRDRVR